MKRDAIGVVESAYDLKTPNSDWMATLVECAVPLVSGAGPGAAYSVDVSSPAAPRFGRPVIVGLPASYARKLKQAIAASDVGMLMHAHAGKATTFSAQLGQHTIAGNPLGDFLLAPWARPPTQPA
jgi:hypothetical protein